jgi:hypothetical protein
VQILVSRPCQPRLPVVFNVDGVVGAAPAANQPDDVILVKAFLRRLGDFPGPRLSPDTVAALQAVQVNATADAALVAAITPYQTNLKKARPNLVVDGRVSPAKEYYTYDGGAAWSIVQLNYDMKGDSGLNPVWPCLHLASACHPTLQPLVKKALYGSGR